jgi:hypothetical protein
MSQKLGMIAGVIVCAMVVSGAAHAGQPKKDEKKMAASSAKEKSETAVFSVTGMM